MANQAERWYRQPETWLPRSQSQWQLFRSLLDHMFAQYPVPGCMSWAWLAERTKPWERELYIHLARGHSVRTFQSSYPWRLTKSGARFFIQAPDDLRPVTAYRWAQIRSLGGDISLARSLLGTVLAAPTADEAFWATVIQFLIENGPFPTGEAASIVQFIQRQRFEPAEHVWGRGAGTRPLQPEFSLAGSSLSALRRHMANWQGEFASQVSARFRVDEQTPAWEPTTIRPLQVSDDGETWTIHELLNPSELRVEGGIMRHCVGSYVSACRTRRTSIWSLRVARGQTQRRELTIEVVPETKTIRQAKGRFNAPPSPIARRMLLLWANRAGLKVDSSVSVAFDR
jgi:hypothetical protein